MKMVKPAEDFYALVNAVAKLDQLDEVTFSEHYIFGGGNTFHHEGKRLERCVKVARSHSGNMVEVRIMDGVVQSGVLSDVDFTAGQIVSFLRGDIDRFDNSPAVI